MKHKYSVLVVDDQENWRELLREIIRDQFEVAVAESVDTALDIIRDHKLPFHVMVTDMRLVDDEAGNEDGLKLVKYINQRGDPTKTIIVTGYPTVGTVKKALSRLGAYDYLEKRPSDGSAFSHQDFQRIVYQAAQDAEKQRPQAFADITYHVLLLESDPSLRSEIENILRKDRYLVTSTNSLENLETQINNFKQDFALILIDEPLANKDILDVLNQTCPNAKIIFLTARDLGNIFIYMQEYPVLPPFPISNQQFDTKGLRDLVHRVITYGAIKYVLAQVSPSNQPNKIPADEAGLIVGSSYNIHLSIHDNYTEGATGLLFLPLEKKPRYVKLHLFIHANQMILEPGAEAYWDIPLSTEFPLPFRFSIIPQASGEKDITVDIDQDGNWLGRIKIRFKVRET